MTGAILRDAPFQFSPLLCSLAAKDEELRRLGREVEAARDETLRATAAGQTAFTHNLECVWYLQSHPRL
jgi:hypothetical protein